MSDRRDLELLVEIARLLKKYGPETFESLAENLSSPNFSDRLVTILSAAASTGRIARTRQSSEKGSKRTPKNFRTSLVELEETEQEKSALLLALYDGLMAKTMLPTLRDIQAFVSDTGLPPLKATARDKAIIPFIRSLIAVPQDELRLKLSTIKPVSTQDDRSLEGWSNIILDKERRR